MWILILVAEVHAAVFVIFNIHIIIIISIIIFIIQPLECVNLTV
jgi:hypothetical protein